MVSICIPTYNQEKTIYSTIRSAIAQDYKNKEILIVDDCSTDNTVQQASIASMEKLTAVTVYRATTIVNETNLGIGANLTKCMNEAHGDYIVFLCGDDYFTDTHVVSDMVRIFEADERVGVIGRPYYQFIDGYPGVVNRVDGGILESSCNPSGIGYRKSALIGEFPNKIFIENMTMVKRVLSAGWGYQIMDYDTVAVRLHENTATKKSYYTESPERNVSSLIPGYTFYPSFISLKIRCPDILLKEIFITIQVKPSCLLSPKFWACVLLSCLPGSVLSKLSDFYRHRIKRRFCAIKSRRRA